MAEIRDLFKIDVDASGAIKKVGKVEKQIQELARAFRSLTGTPTLKNIDKAFRDIQKNAGASRKTIAGVRQELKALSVSERIQLKVEFNAQEALNKLRQQINQDVALQAKIQEQPGQRGLALATKSRAVDKDATQSITQRLALQKAVIKSIEKELSLVVKTAAKEKDLSAATGKRVNQLKAAAQAVRSFAQGQTLITGKSAEAQVQKTLVQDINKSSAAINKQSEAFNANRKAIKDTIAANKNFDKSQKATTATIGNAIVKIVKYRIAFVAMRAAIEALQDSLKTFGDLQLELARLEKVIDPLTANIVVLRNEAFELARAFSTTANEVLKSFTIFAQTGLKQKEVIEATKAALVGMVAVGLDAKSITDALTAVIFTYNIAVTESINVLSKWIAVQAEFPITASDLANALKVIGAAAKVVGVDIDDLAGAVAAIGAITRKSGTAIGQSLKTIFARLPKKETVSAFEEIGIAVFKSASEFRDFDDILADLAKQWPILTDAAKTNIAQTIGGIRRYADFIALMDNFAVKQQATVVSQQASTEAIRAGNLELITFSKTVDKAKAILEELAFVVGGQLAKPLDFLVTVLIEMRESFPIISKILAGLITTITIFTVGILSSVVATKIWIAAKTALLAKIIAINAAVTAETVATGVHTAAMLTAAGATGFWASAINALKISLGPIALLIGIIGALAVTAFSILGPEAKRAVSDIDALVDSLDAETKGLIRANKGLEKQSEVNKGVIETLEKYQLELKKVNKNSERFAEVSDKMRIVLNGIRKETPNLVTATENLKRANDLATVSFDSLNTAMNENLGITERLIERNRAKIGANIAEIRLQLVKEQGKEFKIEAEINDIRDKLKTQPALTIDTKITINGRDVLFSEFIDEQFKGIENLTDLDNSRLGETLELIDSINKKIEEAESGGFGLGAIKEQFRIQLADIPLFKGLNAIEKQLKSSRERFKEFIESLDIKNPDIANALTRQFDLVVGRISNLRLEALNLSRVLVRSEDEAERAFALAKLKVLAIEAGQGLKDFSKNAENALTNTLDVAKATTTELTTSLRILEQFIAGTDTGDAEFLFGKNISKEIGQFQDNLQELQNDIEKFSSVGIKRLRELQEPLTFLSEATETRNFGKGFVSSLNKFTDSLGDFRSKIQNQMALIREALLVEDVFRPDIIRGDKELFAELGTIGTENLLSSENLGKALDKLDKKQTELNGIEKESIRLKARGLVIVRTTAAERVLEFRFQKSAAREDLAQLKSLQLGNQILEKRLSIRRETFSSIEQISQAQLSASQLEFDQAQRIARVTSAIFGQEEAREQNLKNITKLFKDQVRILETEFKRKAELAIQPLIEGAEVFKDALGAGIGDIPDIIQEGQEKRIELQDELVQLEIDLQEARRKGDRQSIADTEQRLRITKEELETYKKGIFEISQVFDRIFGSLSARFWKKITDDFVDAIAAISIGDVSLAEEFGQIFSKVGTQFVGDFDTTLTRINLEYSSRLQTLNNEFLIELERIFRILIPDSARRATSVDVQFQKGGRAVTSVDAGFFDDKTIKELTTGQKALVSALNLVAATLNQALFGGNKTGLLGSQVGSLFGPAAIEKIFGAGLFAGPAGILVGGIIGGVLGSFLGGDKKRKEPERFIQEINKNTDAIVGNTLALKELDRGIFNAPTGFSLSTRATGASFGRDINITINAGNASANDVANEVANIISNDFSEDSLAFSSRIGVNI